MARRLLAEVDNPRREPQKPPRGGAQVGGAVNLAVLFGVQISIELDVTSNGQFYVSGGVQPSWGGRLARQGVFTAEADIAIPSGFSTSYAVTGTVQGVCGFGAESKSKLRRVVGRMRPTPIVRQ